MFIPAFLLYFLCGVLLTVLIFVGIKIYLIKKSIKGICEELKEHLNMDTNTLLTVSSRDKWVCAIAEKLNQQLRVLREERLRYQRGDRELKEAVTNISHDLRTPLTAICGYLHLLSFEERPEMIRHYLKLTENRVSAMTELSEELFQYSVILTKPEELGIEPVDMGNVLEESLAAFYAAFTTRGIVPEIKMPEIRVIREVNKNALARIFENLIGNALKYSDGDFKVVLYEDGRICFSNMAGELNEVAVGRIFDRFFTVETARKSSGLGLSIAKNFTVRMGGKIWAEYREARLIVTVMFQAGCGKDKKKDFPFGV